MRSVEVVGRQPNSRMCFVCGLANEAGLKSRFFELASGELLALFTPREYHQGYPGRLHGGLAAAILDETIGRVMMRGESGTLWGVTVDFSLRLHHPIPLDQEIRVLARMVRDRKRLFEGEGEILLADGCIAARGRGRYMKMDISRIADFDVTAQQWRVYSEAGDPVRVELPDSDGSEKRRLSP